MQLAIFFGNGVGLKILSISREEGAVPAVDHIYKLIAALLLGKFKFVSSVFCFNTFE